ncbi:hypothetical protein NQ317_004678 [Molorchus minor]|uniref:Uncharacterized protein n=1 Tax=Molorchus minor TaxID=1323400 RepID=A0ABQ9JEM4_9CUCU|nr:hypothetical protein NQ317_004678 [Molorchus minor]
MALDKLNRIIDEHIYITIHNRRESSLKLDEIYKIIETNPNEEQKSCGIASKEIFPDADKVIRDNENFRNCFVRGRFPKLPPNYVKRNVLGKSYSGFILGDRATVTLYCIVSL